jgi:hypothetical protein
MSSPTSKTENPKTPTKTTSTVILPSPGSSQQSPSNLPELADVTLEVPAWRNSDEAVSFFLQVRKALRVIMYTYCKCLREAMQIFEECNATHYKSYSELKGKLCEYWAEWKRFSRERNITVNFLQTSVIYLNFDGNLRMLTSPRHATRESRDKMQSLRRRVSYAHSDLLKLRYQTDEAIIRLEEHKNSHKSEPLIFPEVDLSLVHETDQFPGMGISTMLDLPNTVVDESSSDDDEDVEEIVARGGIREEEELIQNGLPPVWTSWGGYPGTIPEEIGEFLSEVGTCRKYHPVCSSRSETFLLTKS